MSRERETDDPFQEADEYADQFDPRLTNRRASRREPLDPDQEWQEMMEREEEEARRQQARRVGGAIVFVSVILFLVMFVLGVLALFGISGPIHTYGTFIVVILLGIAYRLSLGYTPE